MSPPWTLSPGGSSPGRTSLTRQAGRSGRKQAYGYGRQVLSARLVHPHTGGEMIYLATWPTHGTEVFVGDGQELAEVRWVGLAQADELMAPRCSNRSTATRRKCRKRRARHDHR